MLPLNLIEPVVTFTNSQGVAVRGTLTSLQRRALVLEVYNPYSIIQVSEVLGNLTVRAGQKVAYQGRAVVSSLLNTGLMAVVSVTLVDEWSDLNPTAGDLSLIGAEARRFVSEWDERFQIGRSYQVVISEIRAFLADTARWLDQADISAVLPRDDTGRLRDDVFDELTSPIIARASAHLQWLEAEAVSAPPLHSVAHRNFAQTALHPLLLRAPFVYRAFAKPLGYAGDFEIVNQIVGDPRQGASTYFQAINSTYLKTAVAAAHRNRIVILSDRLMALLEAGRRAHKTMRVLNVGCGPALEIQRLRSGGDDLDALQFTLVDFNLETLAYARQQLTGSGRALSRPVNAQFVHESVHDLLRRPGAGADAPGQYDFVYCAGLFDYLSDKVCARLLRRFYAMTAPGGGVLVTNVHPSNPHRGIMEHVLDWHLIYRDQMAVKELVPPDALDVETFLEATGVNVFCAFRVPTRSVA